MKLCHLCTDTCTKRLASTRTSAAAEGVTCSVTSAVRAVADLTTKQGLVCLDLADVRAVFSRGGIAVSGVGEAEGPGRAIRAAEAAIADLRRQLASVRETPRAEHACPTGASGTAP